MDKRMYSNPSSQMSSFRRQSMPPQRGRSSNSISMNNNTSGSLGTMGTYGSQGVKRMRDYNEDPRGVGGSVHRIKWDSNNDDNNLSYMERQDIDQRSETYGQFNDTTMNETSVLCLTIQMPKYPITVEVIRKICSITGQILRICILRKRGVQALVEFDSIETASRIKSELNGADIYAGCCTLKIEYANLKHLVVRGSDQDNLDLTLVDEQRYARRKTLLASPPRSGRYDSSNLDVEPYPPHGRYRSPMESSSFDPYSSQRAPSFPSQYHRSLSRDNMGGLPPPRMFDTDPHFIARQLDHIDHQQRFHLHQAGPNYFDEPPSREMPLDSYVFNIQGLSSSRWNCERLFNLLCLYGNVSRIKFLKSKEGGAMAQMNHCENLRQHLKSLNSTVIFGQTFVIVPSRQTEIQPMHRPFPLENGDLSYMEFETNRNNRYLTSEQASKNRPVAPSNVLYYFNTPPSMTEIDIVRFFEDVGAKRPMKVKNFPSRKEQHNERTRRGANQPRGVTGLAEFRTVTDACECLILANNYPVPHPSSNWPFFFKLTFSSTAITDPDALLAEEMDTSLATVTIENGRRHHRHQSPGDDGTGETTEHRHHRNSNPTP